MASLGARSRARELWDSAESDGFGVDKLNLDDIFDQNGDARPTTKVNRPVGSTCPTASSSSTPNGTDISAASRLATERRRLQELQAQRKKGHVSRRKERRGLNSALLGHGLGALLEDAPYEPEEPSPVTTGVNSWRSTFETPLPAPVARLLNDHTGSSPVQSKPSKKASATTLHSMSLGQATAALANINLRVSDLPPTREAWRLAPQAAREWKVPKPGRQEAPPPTAGIGRIGTDEDLHNIPHEAVGDYGPLQMGIIQMAVQTSQWADALVSRGRAPQSVVPPPATDSVPDATNEADPDATVQPIQPDEIDPTTVCAANDEASTYAEVARTSSYLVWHVPDSFGRLLVHAVARIYDCGSFSEDVSGITNGVPPAVGQKPPSAPRCTFIIHPNRHPAAKRRDLVSSAPKDGLHRISSPRRRRRAASATSAASSTRLTSTSAALAPSRSHSPGTSVTSAVSAIAASDDEWSDAEQDDQVHDAVDQSIAPTDPAAVLRPRLMGQLSESEVSGTESLSASEVDEP